MSSLRIILVALILFLVESTVAQEEEFKGVTPEAVEAKPLTQIVIVAVGPKPPRRFGEKGQMLLPAPSEVPPSRLYYKEKSSTERRADWKTFNITFNNPSAMKSIVPGETLSLYKKDHKTDDYTLYVTIPPGELGSRRVFFLIPSTTGKNLWGQSPLVRTINLDAKSFQGKQFVLKNLSQFTVLHAFEDSVTAVQPMKTIAYTRPKSGQLFRLAARYGTQKKIIYNTAVKLDADGNIQLFALYNANPKTNSGKFVGVFRMTIPAKLNQATEPP